MHHALANPRGDYAPRDKHIRLTMQWTCITSDEQVQHHNVEAQERQIRESLVCCSAGHVKQPAVSPPSMVYFQMLLDFRLLKGCWAILGPSGNISSYSCGIDTAPSIVSASVTRTPTDTCATPLIRTKRLRKHRNGRSDWPCCKCGSPLTKKRINTQLSTVSKYTLKIAIV